MLCCKCDNKIVVIIYIKRPYQPRLTFLFRHPSYACTCAPPDTHTHTPLFYETKKKYNLHVIQATDFKLNMGFPGVSHGKEWACSAGDPGLTPGRGRFP